MKAFTFLGTGDYQTVTYCWNNVEGQRECRTNLFPEAVARIFEPEALLVLVTPTARNYKPSKGERCPTCHRVLPEPRRERSHLDTLVERLGDLVEPVDIPEGKSEAELWEIFDRVASSVEEGETVLLDITHAFRSIPMIVFAVAAYLRRTKRVTIERIIYGAYEAREPYREPPKPTDRAPIFDLTPLLDLLDWLGGAEFLLRRSDAILLAERLQSVHRQAWRSRKDDDLPRRLQTVATKLRAFSQALHLARPRDVMRHARELLPLLEKTASEAGRWTKPFAIILEQVRSETAKLAYNAPDRLDRENLRKQLALIEHFLDKGLLAQAILLAREWIVSWVALQRGDGDWLD
ncbi:MAG: TIGR02221 family CRISPR-associated protein, partial [Candidatus Thorarchaeota archaeon]